MFFGAGCVRAIAARQSRDSLRDWDLQLYAVSMQLPDSQIIPDTLACDIIYA